LTLGRGTRAANFAMKSTGPWTAGCPWGYE